MITLITEQLQKQSLEELKCTSFSISLPLPDHADVASCGSPFQIAPEGASWRDLAPCPKIHLQDSTGLYQHSSLSLPLPPCTPDNRPQKSFISQTLATNSLVSEKASVPPTKRHCRSLSVPEDLSRWQAVWRPLGSKVWTHIKRRDNSGGDTLAVQVQNLAQGANRPCFNPAPSASHQCVQDGAGGGRSPPFFSLALSRESPASVSWETGETLQPYALQRRFSLSPVRFLPSPRSSTTSTPELLRHQHTLPRSRSQPCDLDTRKCGLKRRHDEDVRWHRPSLDFYKMNQKPFAGGVCQLDKSEEGGYSSWLLACSPQAPSAPCSPLSNCVQALSESEEEEEEEAAVQAARRLNWNLASKRTLFQPDFSDLDLTLIEEN
ncbi:protein FAM53C isoform X1 [Rhineura floridana]|uniref:protein FAM53C isoform X1 n=1 Tax=Rhineura floridana TaxID=261503 RepID=UPI002AC80449|nr:protein FAM53C isoform X1 [Rhineura floridana]XP_061473665.1 protein FAM53C isoform X1 [Rhineura floridana]XP_061473667.1 protein FAM53C isoform X1 [Rhineura floridana]XP_061473668.1 protein FAM53C isoform X1 [Rhineura floridana]XP_061473669.1 protein FAM53C isoform X1 [Rhineura floridana]XP_061473670.1 protein FAM53C isoform X1 [Rhineura floridana]XP_061473671.1 protein FAM53C isoform X1 [Rhineura floridana]XP_061473672.1 protein FAM53C isoform X1 [Rhineura floridana]XP_061473673.1 prot